MKHILPFLSLLLLSFAAISCSEDKAEEEAVPLPELMHLSKLTTTGTERPGFQLTATFDYHEGLLRYYKEMDINGKLIVNAVHEYDDLARLSWMISILDPYQNPSPSTMLDRRNEITYDANGRISQVTSTTHWLKTPSDYYYAINYYFSYDAQGRISSIIERNRASVAFQDEHVLEYDGKGNVIRYRLYPLSASGAREQPFLDIAISYDDKKNPFYQLGSIIAPYGLPHSYLNSFIYHLSPNNPVSVKYAPTLESKLSYTYNQSGYPTEIHFDDTTHKLEYLEQQSSL